jgi:hypothetical protein
VRAQESVCIKTLDASEFADQLKRKFHPRKLDILDLCDKILQCFFRITE